MKKVLIGSIAALSIAALLYKNKRKDESNESIISNSLGTLSSGFNNLFGGVTNTFGSVQRLANPLIAPIQNDVINLASNAGRTTQGFFNNIFDVFPNGSESQDTITDFSQFGTPQDPRGFFVLSPENQERALNGSNEPQAGPLTSFLRRGSEFFKPNN